MQLLIPRLLTVALGFLLTLTPARSYADERPAEFHRAYYLENDRHDYRAAREVYEKLAANSRSDEPTRREATRRAARCRDEIAADNFAALMPPDIMAYIEIRCPGGLVRSIAEMTGLAGRDMAAVLAQRPDSESVMPFSIPDKITISPALLDALSSFGGVAAAITDVKKNGDPVGVMILHHGDVALLKGLIETGFQFSPTTKRIGGLPTFAVNGEAYGVLTESLFIAGNSRSLVEAVVERLQNASADSLARRADLAELHASRRGATFFVYADAQRCLKQARRHIGQQDREELDRADAFVDLKSLRWASFMFGAQNGQISMDLTLRLAEDHHNLVYNLIRTPSMSRRSLEFVPPDAVGVVGLGLNPGGGAAAHGDNSPRNGEPAVVGLDLARELFGNMQELTAFVIPGDGVDWRPEKSKHHKRGDKTHFPDAGLVIASGDAERSAALWNQLLAIPAMIDGGKGNGPREVEIGDIKARGYDLPNGASIYMAKSNGCILIGTTRSALRAALRSQKTKRSILNDPVMGAALKLVPSDSTLLAVAHAGRAAALAATMASAGERMQLNMAAGAMKDTIVWFGLGESKSRLNVKVGLRGLPDVNELVHKFVPVSTPGAHAPEKVADRKSENAE